MRQAALDLKFSTSCSNLLSLYNWRAVTTNPVCQRQLFPHAFAQPPLVKMWCTTTYRENSTEVRKYIISVNPVEPMVEPIEHPRQGYSISSREEKGVSRLARIWDLGYGIWHTESCEQWMEFEFTAQ